MLKLFFSDSI